MIKQESEIIKSMLGGLENKKILNIGSSTEEFYKKQQSFIWKNIIKPLKKNNEFVNLDMKKGKGIDIVADCEDIPVGDETYDVILFTSCIEHLRKPEKALKEIKRILKKDGFAILSAPGVYPKHNDPIDTMLRFPNKESWEDYLGEEWKIIDYKQTQPEKAKTALQF
ncbi:MAG: class I SAM-dependent methyltransferase [Candidatus Woesearchaeota archaeon]